MALTSRLSDVEAVGTEVEAVGTDVEAVGTDVEAVGTDVEAVGTDVEADDVASVTATHHPRANYNVVCHSSQCGHAVMKLNSAESRHVSRKCNSCIKCLPVLVCLKVLAAMLVTESTAAAAGSWYARWTDV